MVIMVLLFFAAYILCSAIVAYLIFSPFKFIARTRPNDGARFQITDLLAIFIPFQVGFSSLDLIFPGINWNASVAMYVCSILMLITGIAWIYGMRLLWRMEVRNWIKRVALLGIVMPAGLVISSTSMPILMSVQSLEQTVIRLFVLSGTIVFLRFVAVWVRPDTTASSTAVESAG